MSLGTRMRELREAAGISQEQIAKAVGVSRNAVSQWESDRTRPSTSRLARIAHALKVPIENLLAPSTHMRRRIVTAAVTMLGTLEPKNVTTEAVCAACGISSHDFEACFSTHADLLHEVFCYLEQLKLDEVQRAPTLDGTLAARLEHLLRQLLMHDLKHAPIMRLMHGSSWSWGEARERDHTRQMLGVHDLVVSYFDEAAAQGQINAGNYRAASGLLLATYHVGLRKALLDNSSANRVISFIEPQIEIILRGFGFRVMPGLAKK